jgi:hypothetical protein
MEDERLRIYGAPVVLDGLERWRAESGRRLGSAEFAAGEPLERRLWCRLADQAPADPPDERYYAAEVRPAGCDQDGRLVWETVPGGPPDLLVHNMAEAAFATHLVPAGTVLPVEARLDGGAPPSLVYVTYAPVAPERLARIVSYEAGAYTVQPVRREGGGFVDDGPEVAGVPNIGELWPDEAGYLEGPESYARYVRLLRTPAGWAIVLHPPRMV